MATFSQQFSSGDSYWGQSGTGIPPIGVQSGYQAGAGTGIPPYYNSYLADAPAPSANAFLQNYLQNQFTGDDLAANLLGGAGSAIPGAGKQRKQPILPGEQQIPIDQLFGQPGTKEPLPIQPGFLQLPPA
jgi:hypothetical protein